MKRRTARERALQALYQIELGQIEPKEAIANVLEENNEVSTNFLNELVFGYVDHKEEVDSTIRQHLENWTLERIGSIDRNILRVAISEMNYLKDIPTNVTINEAIEIAKIYGDNDSNRFVNGVLGKIQETHKE